MGRATSPVTLGNCETTAFVLDLVWGPDCTGERGGVSSPELSFLRAVHDDDGDGGGCDLSLADETCRSGGVGGALSTGLLQGGGANDPDVDPDRAGTDVVFGMELGLTGTGMETDVELDWAGTGDGSGDDRSLTHSG